MLLNVAIIVPPLRQKVSFYAPFGALSVIAAAEEDGHNLRLLDLDADRCGWDETMRRVLEIRPDVVGISAIVATSYKYVKDLAARIKRELPDVPIVLGGGLSASGETVLKNTEVDIIVHGEGENTFRELLKRIENKEDLEGVDGISFRGGDKIIRTGFRKLIPDLDSLSFPDYDRLDLDKYILDIKEFLSGYGNPEDIDKRVTDPSRSSKIMRINAGRGCIGRCTFCYRSVAGLRTHSYEYIGDLIEHVTGKYNLGHISFGDECFGPTKEWLWGFIEMLRERKFDLTYHITGMRVEAVDRELLEALKELGVWHIQFGFESGSQKILNIMDKKTTVGKNVEVAALTKEIGISTIPFIIIGYPGETYDTVRETANFIEKTGESCRPTFPMAIPGTPLFEYAGLKGYITDEDEYLEAISDVEAGDLSDDNYFINYTDSSSGDVRAWMAMLRNVNSEAREGKPFADKLRNMKNRVKDQGLRKTFSFAVGKVLEKVKAKHLKNNTVSMASTGNAGEEARCASTNVDIPKEGESLRKINKRLKDNM